MLNIAFDATGILANDSKKMGIDRFSYNMIYSLMRNNPSNRYFCLNLYNDSLSINLDHEGLEFSEVSVYTGDSIELLRMPKYINILGKIIQDFLYENKIDVFFMTEPFNQVATTYKACWLKDVYTVAIVHDVLPLHREDTFFTSRSIQRKYQESVQLLQCVNKVLASTDNTKKDLVTYLGIAEEKVSVPSDNIFFLNQKIRHKREVHKPLRKLAVFSPLPPIQSGIADYIVPLIEEFSKVVDIDIFVDNGYEPDCSLPDNVSVYRHYDYFDKKEEYDEILYEVGGSEYHIYMFDYIREFSGIVDLHDCNLYGLLYSMIYATPESRNPNGICYCKYLECLQEDMSSTEAENQACLKFTNHSAGGIPENVINGFVTNYAKKIIVHNKYSKKILLNQNAERYVEVIPLFAKLKTQFKDHERKSSILLGSFGHITKYKRPVPILKAFDKLLMEGYDLQLIFVGKPYGNFEKMMNKYNTLPHITGRLIVSGFVDEKDYIKNMEKTDIVINLRYPYFGESSATLAQAFGMKKCVIVNNVGAFAELPDDTCIKIPNAESMSPGEEVEQIYSAIKKALCEKTRTTIANNAYAYANRELNIKTLAHRYLFALEHCRRPSFTNSELRYILKHDRSFGGWV